MMDRRESIQLPVLSGTTIPGKHPRLAGWLRSLAEKIDALADRYDDRHVPPWHTTPMTYEDVPLTMTWGSKYTTED